MIIALLVALVYIAIICVIARVIIQVAGFPPPIPAIVWAIATVFCLLILLDVLGGGHYLYYPGRHL